VAAKCSPRPKTLFVTSLPSSYIDTVPVCRGCGFQHCDRLGDLPDSYFFAGLDLSEPIPGGALFRCPDCRLVFRSPILTPYQYNQLYARGSTELWSAKGRAPRTDRRLVKTYIEAQRPQGAKILDVGCNTGEFLSSLSSKYTKCGVENSEGAVRLCKDNGIRIVGDDLYKIGLLDEKFDIVTAMDVIEHTSNPSEFLQRVLHVLADDGIAVITTGDADNHIWRKLKGAFWYCGPAEHISFISERWLQSNAGVNGFRISHLQRFKYDRQSNSRTFGKLAFIYLLPLVGIQPKTWNAHLSADHLFVALRK
jgi:2-polyprenyl-3-methyl-5-hydroxy-6-metoxy-1,4-benzoquinol methylase